MLNNIIQRTINLKNAAYAPYSNFRVGAIIVTQDDVLYTGCNIEISSYSLTICAERVAIFKAVSEGEREVKAIYIATDTENFCPPCGACRQVLWDLAGNIKVIMINKNGEHQAEMLQDLLPQAFDKNFFEDL